MAGELSAEVPDEHARRRPRASARVRRRRHLVFGIVPFVLVAAALSWFFLEAYPLGSEGRQVIVEVHEGEAFSEVVAALSSKGVISSGVAFRIDTLFAGTPNVQPGDYALRQNSPFSAVRARLAAGPNAIAFDVPAGDTTLEMSGTLAELEGAPFAAAFLHLARTGAVPSPFARPGTSLEGLLGTGQYVLVAGEDPRTLLDQMVARFDREAAEVGLTPATTSLGLPGSAGTDRLSAYQLVVVASIVEKEGYVPKNMPKTATVIYNRLARGMPLQMDSTVEYALGQDGGPIGNDEQVRSAYNTYLNVGLVPTPICSMSLDALRAALHPPAGPWLYFQLISADGTMAFVSTYAAQLRNEQLAARRGLP